MRTAIAFLLLALGTVACNSGAADCMAAGGTCRIGGCPSQISLPHDCNNGEIHPGGSSCCAPCPKGTVESDTQRACVDMGDASAEAAMPDAAGG